MKSGIWGLFTGLVLTLGTALAGAQTNPVPPPERTITIDEAEPIDASPRRSGEERIEALEPRESAGLIPIRESFIDRLIESAGAI